MQPDRDPAATCLVMMCPVFRSRPKQVDAIVSSAFETVSKVSSWESWQSLTVAKWKVYFLSIIDCRHLCWW